jgi:hypothetical protein
LDSDPERFHEERSDLAHDLSELAGRLAPRARRTPSVEVDVSAERGGRLVGSTQTINGRRVMVQKQRAFAVFVSERPVKKS